MSDIRGIELGDLQSPISEALDGYSMLTEDEVLFDLGRASNLELTPEKSTAARSESPVKLLGNTAGTLYVIAFEPGDGTGNDQLRRPEQLDFDEPYDEIEDKIKLIGRNKEKVVMEGHFPLVSQSTEDVHAEPVVFGGTYELLSIENDRVTKIGELGQDTEEPPESGFRPLPMLTVGFVNDEKGDLRRFGDPHAVYSPVQDAIQVCAFFAITKSNFTYSNALSNFYPQPPRDLKLV